MPFCQNFNINMNFDIDAINVEKQAPKQEIYYSSLSPLS